MWHLLFVWLFRIYSCFGPHFVRLILSVDGTSCKTKRVTFLQLPFHFHGYAYYLAPTLRRLTLGRVLLVSNVECRVCLITSKPQLLCDAPFNACHFGKDCRNRTHAKRFGISCATITPSPYVTCLTALLFGSYVRTLILYLLAMAVRVWLLPCSGDLLIRFYYTPDLSVTYNNIVAGLSLSLDRP